MLLPCLATLLPGAVLTFEPPVAYDCSNNLATFTLVWSGASGSVDLRVLTPDGPSMTGLAAASGTAVSGAWVTDGMQFYLVNQAGRVEASALARVRCGSTPRTIDQGLRRGSYFPLQVGNTWVYRLNDRIVTNSFVTRTVSGTESINGNTYFVVQDFYPGQDPKIVRLRGDNKDVIRAWNGTADEMYIDPDRASAQSACSGTVGRFDDCVAVATQGLLGTSSTYARGIGLLKYQAFLNSGSSGGFSDSLDLVEARLDGIALASPATRLSVSIEFPDLDITGRNAPNCAVPLYCVACGLVGSDPQGTYRPCVQTRAESSFSGPHTLQLQLFSPSGTLVYETGVEVASNSALRYLRLPLYVSAPGSRDFQILPPGIYRLVARMFAAGVEIGTDTLTVRLR